MRKPIDILCAGELFVDFSTAEFVQSIDEATLFKRHVGGNAALLSMDMARLGNKSMLIATVGRDDMGSMLKKQIAASGADISLVAEADEPSSLHLNLVAAQQTASQIYRGADHLLSIRQFPYGKLGETSIFHTTCFGLSRDPARHVILEAAEKAARAACILSIDVNYAENIWPDKKSAQKSIAEFCRLGALVFISTDKFYELYGESQQEKSISDHFLKMGASEVCLKTGPAAYTAATDKIKESIQWPTGPSSLTDTQFLSAYLTARLDGYSLTECLAAGANLAAYQSTHSGNSQASVDRSLLYASDL